MVTIKKGMSCKLLHFQKVNLKIKTCSFKSYPENCKQVTKQVAKKLQQSIVSSSSCRTSESRERLMRVPHSLAHAQTEYKIIRNIGAAFGGAYVSCHFIHGLRMRETMWDPHQPFSRLGYPTG